MEEKFFNISTRSYRYVRRSLRGVSRTPTNIEDGAVYSNSEQLLAVNYFFKELLLRCFSLSCFNRLCLLILKKEKTKSEGRRCSEHVSVTDFRCTARFHFGFYFI